jgi:hypothetical protein|tara:strand:+ start:53 stop:499 length:447 start_codon:yes stop_codon:yes gene_type:complete
MKAAIFFLLASTAEASSLRVQIGACSHHPDKYFGTTCDRLPETKVFADDFMSSDENTKQCGAGYTRVLITKCMECHDRCLSEHTNKYCKHFSQAAIGAHGNSDPSTAFNCDQWTPKLKNCPVEKTSPHYVFPNEYEPEELCYAPLAHE